jgi:hypothetical protein
VKQNSTQQYQQRFAYWRTVVFLLPILGAFSFISCKDDNLLGLELQPDGQFDSIAVVDSFTVSAFTLLGERQRTDEAQSFLGKVNSPIFGSTESALILNFSMITGNTQVDFTGYSVESVTLHLRPNKVYGDPNESVPVEVFELNQQIYKDSSYYSDFAPSLKPVLIGSANLSSGKQISATDSITIEGEKEAYQFLIPLELAVGEFLKKGLEDSITQDIKSFQSYFYGLMLKVQDGYLPTGDGAIYSMALLTGESSIRVKVTNGTETEYINYPLTSLCARVNQFTHDYAGSLTESYLNNGSKNDDLIFVQGLSGTKAEVYFPGLYQFGVANNSAIAKATLEFQLADNQPATLGHSKQLYLLEIESDGSESLTLDYIYSKTRAGGRFDDDINGYTFDITRHVQRIVDEAQFGRDVNYGLRLHAQVPVLNGNDTAQNVIEGLDNIVLKLYHTDINN